ncbi:hypothetical protein PI124_g16235 [Phytophthora idaei]|nr:hypothetical protein PI125_g27347 [Phytophthora idaei]KAG3238821.1 hypothetical protein PI124_g16235 [Phytophthora idaei]
MPLVPERHTSNTEEAFHDIGHRWNALPLLVLDTLFTKTTPIAQALDERLLPVCHVFACVVRRGGSKRL